MPTTLSTINEGTSMMVNNIGEERLYLSNLLPHHRVLEFGMGISTLTIAPLVRQVISIEHKPDWFADFSAKVPANVTPVFIPANKEPSPEYDDGTFEDFKNYVMAPMAYAASEKFDIVYIDGRARLACAEWAARYYLKPGGLIFIHDYKHPTPEFRRPEYEPVERFLDLSDHFFAMAMFTVKENFDKLAGNVIPLPGLINSGLVTKAEVKLSDQPRAEAMQSTVPSVAENDKTTCWYSGQIVIDEMNRFFDQHIQNHDIRRHMEPFTRLLNCIEPDSDHNLLDLGCGTAMLTEFCKKFAYHGADLPAIIAGCAIRNYPNYFYRGCDIVDDDLSWVKLFDAVVLNGVIDIMQEPVWALKKILNVTKKYLIIHRQEIAKSGPTHVNKNGSYGGTTYHSILNKKEFEDVVQAAGFRIVTDTECSFENWEDGGKSFLLLRIKQY